MIYDFGANVGIASLYFIEKYPNAIIHVFEADPDVFECLKKNLAHLNLTTINLYNKAVWYRNEIIDFSSSKSDDGKISVLSDFDKNKKHKVEAIDVKEVIIEDNIDFIKIDIEGAELPVLKRLSNKLKNVGSMYLEFHPSKDPTIVCQS